MLSVFISVLCQLICNEISSNKFTSSPINKHRHPHFNYHGRKSYCYQWSNSINSRSNLFRILKCLFYSAIYATNQIQRILAWNIPEKPVAMFTQHITPWLIKPSCTQLIQLRVCTTARNHTSYICSLNQTNVSATFSLRYCRNPT